MNSARLTKLAAVSSTPSALTDLPVSLSYKKLLDDLIIFIISASASFSVDVRAASVSSFSHELSANDLKFSTTNCAVTPVYA